MRINESYDHEISHHRGKIDSIRVSLISNAKLTEDELKISVSIDLSIELLIEAIGSYVFKTRISCHV